jgi:hypothetical protein
LLAVLRDMVRHSGNCCLHIHCIPLDKKKAPKMFFSCVLLTGFC